MSEVSLGRPERLAARCENVSKSYVSGRHTVRAVDDVTLAVTPSEFLAIMGPSGSGKSTLIHLLAGLTKPDAGLLEVAGLRLRGASDAELSAHRRTQIGLVFQSSNLLPRLSVQENVELPLLLSGLRPVPGEVAKLLARLGLTQRADHLPNELSGGEQQRAALARALVHSPGIILADEPTGSLDSGNTRGLCEILEELRQDGQTVIVTTHNLEVASYADRVVVMRDGHLAEQSGPGALSPTSRALAPLVDLVLDSH